METTQVLQNLYLYIWVQVVTPPLSHRIYLNASTS